MYNRYLTNFIVLRHNNNRQKVSVAFTMLLTDDQEIELVTTRFGNGYVSFVYKIVEAKTSYPKERLKSVSDTVDIGYDLDKVEFEAEKAIHVTSVYILHNPAMDRDSMTTADAPSI